MRNALLDIFLILLTRLRHCEYRPYSRAAGRLSQWVEVGSRNNLKVAAKAPRRTALDPGRLALAARPPAPLCNRALP